MGVRPAIFIGSSAENVHLAYAFKRGLRRSARCEVWDKDFFTLGATALEDLLGKARRFQFALLVLCPNDVSVSRGCRMPAPRDNLIFEAGLFMGVLGRHATFLVGPPSGWKVPSDLLGITGADLVDPGKNATDRELDEAVGPAVQGVRKAIARELADKTSLVATQLESETVEVAVARSPARVFGSGVELIDATPHQRVLIYGPTGLWEPDESKKKWFRALGNALENRRLAHLVALFGLPPLPKLADHSARVSLHPGQPIAPSGADLDPSDRARFERQLAEAQETLRALHGQRAQLYWLVADTEGLPGNGFIVIDDDIVIQGFATVGERALDSAIAFAGAGEATRVVADWFNFHARSPAATQLVLQDREQCLADGFGVLRETFGLDGPAHPPWCRHGAPRD